MSDIENIESNDIQHEQPDIDLSVQQNEVPKRKRKLTPKQLEAARRNMELGRKKRAENIAKRKAEKEAMARSQYDLTKYLSNNYNYNEPDDVDENSSDEYEEIVINNNSLPTQINQVKSAIRKTIPIRKQKNKESNDAKLMERLMYDLAEIKQYLTTEKSNKANNTIIKIEAPKAQVQPQEPPEATQQKKKILLNWGNH